MSRDIRVLFVHMIQYDINDDSDPPLVGEVDYPLKSLCSPPLFANLLRGDGPVPMIPFISGFSPLNPYPFTLRIWRKW